MAYSDSETALVIWEMLENETTPIYLAIIGNSAENTPIFLEGHKQEDKTTYYYLRVFLDRDEAHAYRTSRNTKGLVLISTTLSKLTDALNAHWKKKVDVKVDCVLSTVDIEGIFYSLELLWSNVRENN